MGLSRLDNFLKSVRGAILYVDPNSLDSTDSIENQGNSLTRPFKTIQRALLEASRFSYQRGLDNDRFNKTTILLYPGDHIVDNRPGYIPLSTGQFLKRSSTQTNDFSPFDLTTNFDLSIENNALYKLNSVYGGVIIPRGTSIVGMDLRKTKIRPTYVPNPENDQIERSCIFRVTGACYLWQFTILDADQNGICYKDYTSNTFVPNFSHHKLTGFEYADGVNPVSIADDFITFTPDGRTDLDMYYDKVGIAYGQASGRPIEPDYPSSTIDIQPIIDEYRIVGSRGIEVGISSIRAGDGVTGTTTITLNFAEETDQFNVDTPIQINGVASPGYDGQYVISNVLSSTQIQYEVQNTPENPLPSVIGATINITVDTVTSASPYIFNISLRSVWGMCGLLADGNKAAGFKSMVVAQYTGIGLQKDDNAFIKYDIGSGTYIDAEFVPNIHSDSNARFKPSYENFHIKATNNAYLQLVSVFAIGFAEHFVVESGGDFSINNSNSNFGAKSLSASGFRVESFPRDDVGYFTHIIPPKEIESSEISVDYLALDVSTIVSAATTSRLYIYGETNPSNPPVGILDGYRIGAKNNDKLHAQISQSGVTTEYSARIVIPNNGIVLDQNSSEKTFNVTNINANVITLNSLHSFINGESIRIISEGGDLPNGIINNQVYYAITKEVAVGIGSTQIQVAQTLNDAINNNPFTINSNNSNLIGLTVVSRVSDKDSGDIGHPVQFDTTQNNWYVNVATDNTIYPIVTSLGTAGLGNATPRTYLKRSPDTRNLIDKAYRIRYVLPKDSPITARPPLDGYVIQESNNTIGAGTTEISKYFSIAPATLSNSTELKNPRFIANANWSTVTKTANIITELPHDLTVGAQVEVLNIISTNNIAGVANFAYNGTFTVTGISSTKQFSYSLENDPGTFTNNTSSRDSSLPRFNRKKLSGTYYIYRSQEIKKYIPNVQDGVYHLIVVNSSNSPTVAPFNDLRFSQPLQNLYPQTNRDNPNSDPKAARSFALPDTIGQVIVNEPQNSITKETVENSLSDFNVGVAITNILSSSGIAHTLYTTIDHGLCGVTSVSILNGGSGYVEGTYYNASLTGSANGVNATARVTVGAAGTVTTIKIMDGGSAYVVGNTASLVGVGTTGSGAVVTITNIYNNVGDCLSISGVSSASYAGYNTLYQITGITTSKEISVRSAETISEFSATGLGVTVTTNANVLLTGRTLGISTFTYNSTTGVGIVTFTSAHGLLVNNKVRLTGFDDSSYNGDYLVKQVNSLKTSININVGSATTSLSIGAGSTAYIPALTSYGGDLDINNESTSGRLISEYAGITTTLGATVSATALEASPITIPNAVVLGLNIGDYIQIDNEVFRINTTVTDNFVYAFRGLFSTPRQQHNVGSVVRRIKVLPVELRRNSIIRASGHTFEYLGFGPGNYSTAFPERQDRSLSDQEILLAQSFKNDGGISIYTGMDDKGNFFTGNKKVNSATGQEEVYDAPIPTVTGEDPTGGLNVGFDVLSPLQISVNRSIKVEGGADSNLLSEFDGPVVFNNRITSTSPKGLEVKSLFIQGDIDVSRKITVGISTPVLAGNIGDQVYNAYPQTSGYIGWVYTSNNLWEKYGRISPSRFDSSVGISSGGNYVGIASLIDFRTSGITLSSQYDTTSGITTLTFTGTGPQVTTIGISTSTSNTFAGVGTQINFVGTNIGVSAKTDTVSGITTVNLVGLGTTSIYRGLQFIKTNGQSTGGIPNILRVDGTESALQTQDVFNALGFIPAQSSQTSNYPTGNSIVLDSIGSQFNGTLTDFTMRYVGVAYTPFGSSANLIVSIGGVIQKPGLDFSIVQGAPVAGVTSNTSTIRFTTAPTAGLSDFIVSLGGQGILLEDPSWDSKGQIVAATGNNAAVMLNVGANNTILTADSTTATGLAWKNTFTGNVTGNLTGTATNATNADNADNATNLNGGIASQIPYQYAPNITAFIPNGTSNQLLKSNGTDAPSWTSNLNLSGNVTANAFFGDGSGLTGINVPATGIIIKDAGTTIGTAGTINFNTGLNVSAIINGSVTVDVGTVDNAINATNADNINISAISSVDTTTSVVLVGNQATGNQSPFIDSGLIYDANSNALTATTFNGNATSATSAISATSATNATNANNINISATASTDTTTSVVLVGNQATGNQSPFIDSGLIYDANSNTLTASTFNGNATSATTATNANNINISATSSSDTTTSVVLVGNQATGNQSPFIDSGLIYDANSNTLSVPTLNVTNGIRGSLFTTGRSFSGGTSFEDISLPGILGDNPFPTRITISFSNVTVTGGSLSNNYYFIMQVAQSSDPIGTFITSGYNGRTSNSSNPTFSNWAGNGFVLFAGEFSSSIGSFTGHATITRRASGRYTYSSMIAYDNISFDIVNSAGQLTYTAGGVNPSNNTINTIRMSVLGGGNLSGSIHIICES